MNLFLSHFERCALASLEKREKLLALAGEHFLELDLDAGMARFSDRGPFPFQVLGTESENSLSWLWAWADEQTEMPDGLMRSSREMRAWLEANGMTELTTPSVDLDLADGIQLAVVASDVCKASAFYRDTYEGGSLLLLLFGSEIIAQPDLDRQAFIRLLADLASRYEFDQRNAVVSYFEGKGLPCAATDFSVNAQLSNGERILAEFGADRRLQLLNGEPLS